MKIDSTNNLNYKGGYYFKDVKPETRKELDSLINRGKQIFYDYGNKGDIFYVVRDKYDKKVAKFISNNDIVFSFYPTVNTRLGLDSEVPETISYALNGLEPATSDINILLKLLNKKNTDVKKVSKKITDESLNSILKTLQIDINEPIIRKEKGIYKVNDPIKKRDICITPVDNDGHIFVYIESDLYPDDRKYKMTTDGKVLQSYITIAEIGEFFNNIKKRIS